MTKRQGINRALQWNAIDLLTRNGFKFLIFVVLSRILSPADFGLTAMLALFVAVAALLINSGFSQALIQRQNTTAVDESTIFYFTLAMGGGVALVLCAVAPWIATFYNQPILQIMTYWMALNLFLNSFGTIHTTLLTKYLDFKTLTKASIIASLVSGGVAILMAWQGWGVWSLVGRILVDTITTVIMLWFLHSWRPKWAFSHDSLRSFFSFGGFLLWTGLLNTLYTNLYALLIGKMHTVQDVGYYTQAQRMEQLPVNVITSIVGRVAFPVFAAAAGDRSKLSRGLGQATTSVMFITIPLMFWLMMLSEEAIQFTFGQKWLPAAPVLQALAISGLLMPLNVLNINVLKAQGYSALNARIQIIKLSVAISLLFLSSPYGIVVVAYGQVVASFFGFFVNTYYTGKLLNYGWKCQVLDMFPYFCSAMFMALPIWAMKTLLDLPTVFELIASALLGGGLYILICKLAKLNALEVVLNIVRNKK